MTTQEFHNLLSYQYAKRHAARFNGTTKKQAKGRKREGRLLVPLERVFAVRRVI